MGDNRLITIVITAFVKCPIIFPAGWLWQLKTQLQSWLVNTAYERRYNNKFVSKPNSTNESANFQYCSVFCHVLYLDIDILSFPSHFCQSKLRHFNRFLTTYNIHEIDILLENFSTDVLWDAEGKRKKPTASSAPWQQPINFRISDYTTLTKEL